MSERPDLDFQVEIDVIPDLCAIWRFTGGGLVAAKGGYHYVDFRPGNKMLNRSSRKKVDRNYERNCGVVAGGLLMFNISSYASPITSCLYNNHRLTVIVSDIDSMLLDNYIGSAVLTCF